MLNVLEGLILVYNWIVVIVNFFLELDSGYSPPACAGATPQSEPGWQQRSGVDFGSW